MLVHATESFFAGNLPEPIRPEDIYEDTHPVVRQYRSKFVPVRIIQANGRVVESSVEAATAAPGEKRQVRKP